MDEKKFLKTLKMSDRRKFLKALETLKARDKQIEESPSWQHYTDDIKIKKGSIIPMGFHKVYAKEFNRKIIDILYQITVFPHYYVSFYGSTNNEPVSGGKNGIPGIYRSDSYKNMGMHSFVKLWDSSIMDGDSFMMFMGWPQSIMADMEMLVSSAKKNGTLWSGNDMITDLFKLCGLGREGNLTPDYVENFKNIRRVNIEIEDNLDYHSFVLKTMDVVTSVEISPDTRENIKNGGKKGLIPICQIPFGLGGYHHFLTKNFDWDEAKVPKADFLDKKHPIYTITPGYFGHECGGFYDTKKGRVIGKRRHISEFIRFLNQENLLHEYDLKYLV